MELNRLFWPLCLVYVLILGGCKTNHSSVAKTESVGEDFFLEFHRTGCRGDCPNYYIRVNAKGETEWEGLRGVERLGKWQKSLSSKIVSDLADALEESKFWELATEYGTELADVPGIQIEATHNGKTHRVWDVQDAPESLKKLEARIESLIGTSGYTKTP